MAIQTKALRLDTPDLQLVGNLARFLAARHIFERREMLGFFPNLGLLFMALGACVWTCDLCEIRRFPQGLWHCRRNRTEQKNRCQNQIVQRGGRRRKSWA